MEKEKVRWNTLERDVQRLIVKTSFQTSNVVDNSYDNDVNAILTQLKEACKEFISSMLDLTEFCKCFFASFASCFEALTHRIESGLKHKAQLNLHSLQSLVNLCSIASGALQSLHPKLECKDHGFLIVNLVSKPILGTLLLSYQHCKDSQESYGSSFKKAAASLKQLFQESFKLQKVWGAVLNNITLTDNISAKSDQLTRAFSQSLELCKTVRDIDNMLLVTSWKMLLCFAAKCKTVLKGHVDCSICVDEITSVIIQLIKQCRDLFQNKLDLLSEATSSTVKAFSDSIKLTSFLTNLLASFCHDYDLVGNDSVVDRILCFVRASFLIVTPLLTIEQKSASLPSNLRLLVGKQLMDSFDKCIAILLPSDVFQAPLLNSDSSADRGVADLMLLIRAMRVVNTLELPPPQCYGEGPRDSDGKTRSIFKSVFNLLPSVYVELFKSTRLHLDGPQPITLYQTIASHMCAFGLTVPPQCFGHLEVILVENVLSSHPYRHLMALDLWIFIARRAGADICYRHVDLLVQMSKRVALSQIEEIRLGAALYHLLELLPAARQQELARKYPLSCDGNLLTWKFAARHFVLSAPNPGQRAADILKKVSGAVDAWTKSGQIGLISDLLVHFRIVAGLFRNSDESPTSSTASIDQHLKSPACKSHLHSFVTSLMFFWTSLPTHYDVTEILMTLYGDFLRSFAEFIACYFTDVDLKKVVRKCREIVNRLHPNDLDANSIECCFYGGLVATLEALKSVALSHDVQDDVMLLWRRAILASRAHWHLRCTTLRSFSSFSRATKHPRLVARVCSDVTAGGTTNDSDVTTVSEMVKTHLQQKIVPLPAGQTINDVIIANRDALDSVRICACRVTDVSTDVNDPAADVRHLLDNITDAVERLRKIPKENFSPQTVLSLNRSVAEIRELLENR